MNAEKHSMVTGAPATISKKAGSKFSAHGDYIKGTNLQLRSNKLIVQSWRASEWTNDDIDSTFIIQMEQKGKDVVLHVVHANLPDKHAKSIDKGWHDHYWNHWKQYLAGGPITLVEM